VGELLTRFTASVAGLATLAVMSVHGAPPTKPPESVRDLPSDGTTVVADDKGRFLSYERAENRLTSWDSKGRRDASCRLDLQGESAWNLPRVALSGGIALVSVFSPEGTRLRAMELSTCRFTAQRDLKGLVFDAAPARDGWLLNVRDRVSLETRFLLVDSRLRTYSDLEVSEDVASLLSDSSGSDSVPQPLPGGQERTSTGFVVAGEVWVVPSSRYLFVRPRQKGKEARSFEPAACLTSKGRSLSKEEVRAGAVELARRFEKDPQLGPLFKRRAESADPGWAYSPAIAQVAVNGRWAGVAVSDERGCRLDVWDMDAEAPAAVARIGSSCPGFFTFNEERVLIRGEGGFKELPFTEPLGLPLKRPCDAETAPKAMSGVSETAVGTPENPPAPHVTPASLTPPSPPLPQEPPAPSATSAPGPPNAQ
jgi:hypothetical protein